TSRPVRSLRGTRGRRPAGATRRARPRPWGIPSGRAGCGPSPSGGSGTGVPDRLPSGKESHRRIARGTWSSREATRRRGFAAWAARSIALVLTRAVVGIVLGRRDQTEHRARFDTIVLQAMNLGQASGERRGNVESRGPDQHLDQSLPLPDAISPRGKPMTD